VGSIWLEAHRIADADRMEASVRRHGSCRLVLCGHVHQEFHGAWGGVPVLGTPATGFQFAPGSAAFAVDFIPPGFRTLTLRDDGTFSSSVTRVPEAYQPPDDASGY
jgi:Icc protein